MSLYAKSYDVENIPTPENRYLKKNNTEGNPLWILVSNAVSFGTALEKVLGFVKSPYIVWSSGDVDDKRLALQLVFAGPLEYSREKGFGTANLSIALRLFEQISASKSQDVEMGGIEPPCKEREGRNLHA